MKVKVNKKLVPIKYPMLLTDGDRYAIATSDRDGVIITGHNFETELIVNDNMTWEADGFYPSNDSITITN